MNEKTDVEKRSSRETFEEYWAKFGEQLLWNSWVEKYGEFIDQSPYAPPIHSEEVAVCTDEQQTDEQLTNQQTDEQQTDDQLTNQQTDEHQTNEQQKDEQLTNQQTDEKQTDTEHRELSGKQVFIDDCKVWSTH